MDNAFEAIAKNDIIFDNARDKNVNNLFKYF